MAHYVPPPYHTLYPSVEGLSDVRAPSAIPLSSTTELAIPPPTPDSDSDLYDGGRGLARPQQSAQRMLAGDDGPPALGGLAAPRPVPGYSDDLTALPWNEGAPSVLWTPLALMGTLARGVGAGAARLLPAPLETWSLKIARADIPQVLVWGLPCDQYHLLPRAVQREDLLAAAELWEKGPAGNIAGSAAAAAGLAQATVMHTQIATGTITPSAAEATVAAARSFVSRLVASGHTLRSLHVLGLRWDDLLACGLTARALCVPAMAAALIDAPTMHMMRVTLDTFLGSLDEVSAERDPTAYPTAVYALRSRAHPAGGIGLTAGGVAQLFHVGAGGSATPFKCLVHHGLTADTMVVAPYLCEEWFVLLDLCADDVRRGIVLMPVHWAALVRTRGWPVEVLWERLELPIELFERLLVEHGIGGFVQEKEPAVDLARRGAETAMTGNAAIIQPSPVCARPVVVAAPTAVRPVGGSPAPQVSGGDRKYASTVLPYAGPDKSGVTRRPARP